MLWPALHAALRILERPGDVLFLLPASKIDCIVAKKKHLYLTHLLQEVYVTSTKRQKMQISRSVVKAVRSMNPPGRFLERDPETGLYYDIGDKKAAEKTSQALRDGAAALRKQLSQDLGDPNFLSAVFDSDSVTGSHPKEESDSNPKAKVKVAKASQSHVKKGHRRTKSNPDGVNHSQKRNAVKMMMAGDLSEKVTPVQGRQYIATENRSPLHETQSFDGRFGPTYPPIHQSIGFGGQFLKSHSFDGWHFDEGHMRSQALQLSPMPSNIYYPPLSPFRSPSNSLRNSLHSLSPLTPPKIPASPKTDLMVPCLLRSNSWERHKILSPRLTENQFKAVNPSPGALPREFLPPLPPNRRSRTSPTDEKKTDGDLNDSLTTATAESNEDYPDSECMSPLALKEELMDIPDEFFPISFAPCDA